MASTHVTESRSDKPQRLPRAGTKQAMLVGMLMRASGATIRELVEETGWKANTVHSALATLRNSGSIIVVDFSEDQRRYHLTGKSA